MFTEGRGAIAPMPVDIEVDRHTQVVLLMEAERRAAHRRYGARSDAWGRGLIQNTNGVSRAVAPILVGIVGEWAFAEYVNTRLHRRFCETDMTLNNGDGGRDFEIASAVHQIKTRQKQQGPSYVRRVSERKQLCAHTAGRFVFTQWRPNQESCRLLGWVTHKELLEECRFQKSPIAGHFNHVIPDELLRPMDRLLCEIKSDASLEALAWH